MLRQRGLYKKNISFALGFTHCNSGKLAFVMGPNVLTTTKVNIMNFLPGFAWKVLA